MRQGHKINLDSGKMKRKKGVARESEWRSWTFSREGTFGSIVMMGGASLVKEGSPGRGKSVRRLWDRNSPSVCEEQKASLCG